MSSFSSESTRIALLGLAFEFSRFVAREILETISPLRDINRTIPTENNLQDENRSDLERNDKRHDNFQGSYLNGFIERIQQLNPMFRYAAIGIVMLFPPSILLLWTGRMSRATNSLTVFGATYVSSIVTSFGLLLCLYPEINSVDESSQQKDTDNIENGHNVHLRTPDKSQLLPPLAIPKREAEEEYRPRSDSLLSQNTEASTPQPQINEQSQKRYLEILVHNVSHTDLILGLSDDGVKNDDLIHLEPRLSIDSSHTTPRSKSNLKVEDKDVSSEEEKYILCRPRFSAFDLFSKRVKTDLSRRRHSNPIISYPRYERSNAAARYTLVTPRPGDQSMLPVGFNLEKTKGAIEINDSIDDELVVDANDMPSLRVRGRDVSRIDPALLGESPRRMGATSSGPTIVHQESNVMDSLRINAVFFPLMSTLLPRWLGQIADKYGNDATNSRLFKNSNVKKVIVLVSGVGSPRNWTHSVSGNSTQICADLMELFIRELFPDVTVIKIHSQTNIFRYDENISFATQELMPCIDAYRDAHARSEPYPDEIHNHQSFTDRNPFNPDWRQTVSVAYSFADGSAARTHAIQSALRPYRPTYLHFWQLKTFWHASKVTTEDIEVLSFEEIETVPAIAVDMTSGLVQKVIDEMKVFRKDFLETLKGEEKSDLTKFWLRKSRKPVLAVLLVQKQNGKQVMYRGTNMEVSMPTGSLCAERNAIGTALATDPSLRREDLLMVAVLSVQLPPSPPPGPSIPYCRPTNESLDFVVEVSEKLKLQSRDEIHRSTSISSIAEANITDEWEMEIVSPPRRESSTIPEPMRLLDASSPTAEDGIIQSGASTPKHHISLYKFADPKSKAKLNKRHHHLAGISKNKKRLLLVQSPEDINPLKPCGACNEWLKKIAESNPHFKVLTFTDESCKGVYVSPCQE